ncbi:MAG: (Fe-S)-binding protein, partial [Deltaproteobacteria bacterium]
MAKVTPLEIVKRTPRNNCGACGYPACLAFGAAVAAKGEDPGNCPFLDRTGLDLTDTVPLADSIQRDLELVRHLKSKTSSLNFATLAPA